MARQDNPTVGFRFSVNFTDPETNGPYLEQDGDDACFQKVSGISVEFETETVTDGNNTRFVQKLPKKPIFPNLVLERGLLLNSGLLHWIKSTLDNNQVDFKPLNADVKLRNELGEPLMQFRFINAWPVKWTLTDFNAMESSIVMETFELTYQYMTFLEP